MKRSDECAFFFERLEHPGRQQAAGVQNDFPRPIDPAPRQPGDDTRYFLIRKAEEDNLS